MRKANQFLGPPGGLGMAFGSLDFPICVDYVKTAPFGQKCDPERGGVLQGPGL